MTTSAPQGSVAGSLDEQRLHAFLRAEGLTTSDRIHVELVSGGRSNLTYFVGDGVSNWVLRRPPLGHVERGAHDVGREYRVMAALAETAVPVPTLRVMCEDLAVVGAPFYLMDRVEGVVLRTREQVSALPVSQRARIAAALPETLAAIHDVGVSSPELARLGRPDGFLERQLSRWGRQFGLVSSRELDTATMIVAGLRRTMPTSPPATVVHGDYRIDNVMVDVDGRGTIAAVLDWEMATLGDPMADLGMLAMFWDEVGKPFNPISSGLTAFDGFGSAEQMIERYAAIRPVVGDDLDWYLCFSQFKLAVILEQIAVRHESGQTLGDGFDGISTMVDGLLESAASRVGALN